MRKAFPWLAAGKGAALAASSSRTSAPTLSIAEVIAQKSALLAHDTRL